MFRYMLSGGDLTSFFISTLLSLPIILLSLSLHEAAHGFAALKLGDPTARNLGRLTLNPVKHLDPLGALCMLLAGFGWANPVPINTRNFRKPRRDMALSALAGPVSNLLLAFLFVLLLRFVGFGLLMQVEVTSEFTYNLIYFSRLFLWSGVYMNLTLAVFNLLPIPLLDGSRILLLLLPPRLYFKIAPYERYITLVLVILLLVGPLSSLISLITNLIAKGLFALVGLSGFLI